MNPSLRLPTRAAFFALAIGAGPARITAQTVERVPPEAFAIRTRETIQLDGRLDEVAWSAAPAVTEFTQRDPHEGEPGSERTDVRILYDDEAIYIGARLFDSSGRVSSRLGRRDQSLAGSDWFSVGFDSYHDHLSEYRFSINPAGVRRDEKRLGGSGDESWDPVWRAATTRDSTGWVAEMRIPLSQLRFADQPEQTWGIQLIRKISARGEESWFAFTPKRERSGVRRFGHLVGLRDLASRGRLELLPYVVARARYGPIAAADDEAGFADPFADRADGSATAGLDLRYRIASNVSLDATVNPDFGQIEADPATINLTAFETRLSERRPFFVQGADIYRFGGDGGPQLFYSRRIGAPPGGRVPSVAVYDDMPESSTIAGAARLSGKVGAWSLGIVDAVTTLERARYVTDDEEFGTATVAPWTNHLVLRARREFREGSSTIGVLATALNRRLDDDALALRLRSTAYAAGMDFSHDWHDRAWSLGGYAVTSRIAGNPLVITAAQRSSARYYQRPDATHLDLHPETSTLTGFSARLALEKEAGQHWRGHANAATISPGYETNDLGFQSRADQHTAGAGIEYVNEEPGRVLREWKLEIASNAGWNYDGDRLATRLSLEGSAELLSYWSADFELHRELGAIDDRLTRGGPLAAAPARTSLELSIESDARRRVTLDTSFDYADGAAGSSTEVSAELGFRPAPAWAISISPAWTRDRSAAQFLAAVTDTLARATFARRYIFAPLDESELSLSLRMNVTFRPDLSLELYARPFLGSGRFGPPRQLVAPRTFRFDSFGPDGTVELESGEYTIDPDGAGPARPFTVEDDDFTLRSLRGNAVLRWEWRPGSTLFVVWHQQREAEVRLGDTRIRRDLRALSRIPPDNVFTIKISYWINP